MSACPPQDVLERLLNESLGANDRETLEEHLAGCAACQGRLEQLTTDVSGPHWRSGAAQPPRREPSDVFLERLAEVALDDVDTLGGEAVPTPLARPYSPPSPDELEPSPSGENRAAPLRVPGYEILSELGRGGMGVVYLARQTSLNRLIALKMILAGAHAGQEDRARFRAEAEAVARLQHPNIVQIYEVGEHEGLPFLCLEYVPGGSLARHLAGTPQAARGSAVLLETLARAIHAAHERGIVHRDLKPANILLQANSESRIASREEGGPAVFSSSLLATRYSLFAAPKITDFGLAKRLDSQTLGAPSTLAGTPSYMAPEQVLVESGGRAPATDIYALGAILYEMLTGQPPFHGETPYETLMQVVHREPLAPRQFQPRVPRDLETVCLRCLEKEPHKRYASARDLADDLQRFLAGRPVAARPAGMFGRTVKWARRRPAVAGLLMLVALVTVVGLTLVLWQWDRAERRAAAEADLKDEARAREQQERELRREVERLSAGIVIDQAQALCEQGEVGRGLLTYVRGLDLARGIEDADLERVARVGLATWPRELIRERARFSHGSWAVAAALSPDGRMVVTAGARDKVAQRWQADTGQPLGEPLRHEEPVWAVAISPDGKIVLTGSGAENGSKGEARLWDAATGKPLGPPLAHDGSVGSVAFNPRDGRTFLTVTQRQARLWDTATRRPVGEPLRHSVAVLCGVFSPDGKQVVTTGAVQDPDRPNQFRGEAQLWDAATGRPRGRPLTQDRPVQVAAFSPDGKRVVTGGWDNTARLWEMATGKAGPVFKHRGPVLAVAFSADGETVATGSVVLTVDAEHQALTEGGGEARLWQVRTGKPLGEPLAHARAVGAVALSPDGRFLLTGCKDSSVRFFRVASGKQIGPARTQGGVVNSVAFSRDGKMALTTCTQGGDDRGAVRLWELPSEPDPRREIAYPGEPEMIQALAFSPDDDGMVLLTGAQDQTARLFNVTTGKGLGAALAATGKVTAVAFSPDGKRMVAATDGRGVSAWDRGSGRLLYRCLQEGRIGVLAFRPDGRTFLAVGDSAQVWDTATGKPQGPTVKLDGAALGLSMRPDGTAVLILENGRRVGLWDLEGRRFLRTWPHPRLGIGWLGAALSPDGRVLLTGGDTPYAQFWDVSTGRPKGPPLAHQPARFAFSPDSRTAVTCGGWGGEVRLWDVATGRALGVPLRHREAVFSVAFRPDGRTLATGGGGLCVWPMPEPLAGSVESIRRRIEALTGLEMDAEGAIRELDADALRQRRGG